MAPKGTPPKSQASGTFHLPPPPSKNPAPTKSAATTGDLPAWKCSGPSTDKAAKPSYLQVSQVQGKGAGKQATRPFEEMAVERFRSSVDSYVEGKLQEIAKAGDAEASVILQKMQQNSASIQESHQLLLNATPQPQAAQATAPAPPVPCAAACLDATAQAAQPQPMATGPHEAKPADISAPATASRAAQNVQPNSSGSYLDSVRTAVKQVLAEAAASGDLPVVLSQAKQGPRPPFFEDKAVQTDGAEGLPEATQPTVRPPAEPAPSTHTEELQQEVPESNDRYNHNSRVGDNCQICGRFVRGGNEAMMLHQRTSSRCAAAQGTSGEARVPCAYCGRRLAANNAWARQQHYQFCPGRQTDSDDNGSWSSRGSAGWQNNSYSRRHDSWHRSWDSDRWREENDSHPQSHRWHWY